MHPINGLMSKIHYTRFPVTFPYRRRSCQLVTDLLRTYDTANKSATSRNKLAIWETTRHNTHNGILLPAATCYGLAMGKLV